MEHIPSVFDDRTLLNELLVIENLTHAIPYDDQGFWAFPQRRGFSSTCISQGLIGGSVDVLITRGPTTSQLHTQASSSDRADGGAQTSSLHTDECKDFSVYASLIQSWFYFGMLHECLLRPVAVDSFFKADDRGRQVLNTDRLRDEVDAWEERLEEMPAEQARECIANGVKCVLWVKIKVRAMSDRIQAFSTEYLRTTPVPGESSRVRDHPAVAARTRKMNFWRKHGREILPNSLELAIAVLGYSLHHAARTLYLRLGLGSEDSHDYPRPAFWYIPPELKDHLTARGFCKLDVYRFQTDLGILGSCIALTLKPLNESKRKYRHDACTETRCDADTLDPTTYERKHETEGCHCSELLPERAWRDMLDIVEDGGIPVVRLGLASLSADGDQGGLEFEVLDAVQNGHHFVAFSHVWADGRGNLEGNALLRCQWLQLQRYAQGCRVDTDPPPHGKLAGIMPFWFDIFCVPRGPGDDDLMYRLRTKAILRMSEIYRSAAVVLIVDSGLEPIDREPSLQEFGMRLTLSSWLHRLWTMHEGAVAENVKVQTAAGLVDLQVLSKRFNDLIALAKSPARGNAARKGHVFDALGLVECASVWDNCLGVLQRMRGACGAQFRFMFSWNEAGRRSTTFSTDRCLVIGLINDVDSDTLAAIQRTSVDSSATESEVSRLSRQKLKVLLAAIPHLPSSMVFCEGERFPERGMRWAPADLDSGGDTMIVYDQRHPASLKPGRGLLISYRGWRLETRPDFSRRYVIDQGGTRECSSPEEKGTCIFYLKLDCDSSNDTMYALNVDPLDWSFTPFARPNTQLFLVVQERYGGEQHERVILLEQEGAEDDADQAVTEGREESDVIHANYHVLLWCSKYEFGPSVKRMKQNVAHGKFQVANASWVNGGREQRWCIG
ncbi:uncharacterized protein A1O5_10758 [Cladophialophora psammophila CBS 110553]|uniref:Heterokaryon incompatibility domain-containing protein n=1 Tax=Cladophialophora psammophila CBS 110553 TaxID=1182543 RepID=W9WDX2_9EURO|nr:uncharacterized protein A1O5_10758 [Cladophialophora psammophila CBS 110553]EXJ66143.1 hypothetical protein A1O5_10758 [Cladophialophora psammophila CBS 110553]